ncbi:MAG: hypothetical protein JOZ17_09350, partial [Acetobacteraceae bacterium]|nr:hypothetical protein [Acetobacteraceae bacterium]
LSNGLPTDLHLPALLLIEQRAWWPSMFDNPSQQPIRKAPELEALADRLGHTPTLAELTPEMTCGYDALLVLAPPRLLPIADNACDEVRRE